jgi:hypothetical protein
MGGNCGDLTKGILPAFSWRSFWVMWLHLRGDKGRENRNLASFTEDSTTWNDVTGRGVGRLAFKLWPLGATPNILRNPLWRETSAGFYTKLHFTCSISSLASEAMSPSTPQDLFSHSNLINLISAQIYCSIALDFLFRNYEYFCRITNIIRMCVWVPYHHGMARPQVADGGDGLQIWRVAANILNKQSRTADKGWSSSLGVGRGANNSSP